jgi:hypothetical protein
MKKHEESDVTVSVIPWVLAGFIAVAVLIQAVVWVFFRFYERVDQSRDVRRTLIQPPSPIPPEPRLQIHPEQDLQRFRQSQMELLNSYGWVSKEEKRVRIPIGRAMDLLVQDAARTAK